MLKSFPLMLAFFSIAFQLPAHASLNSQVTEEHADVPFSRLSELRGNGIYRFSADTELTGLTAEDEEITLRFSEGEDVAVQIGTNGDVLIQLIPDANEEGLIPEELMVNLGQFAVAGVSFQGSGGLQELVDSVHVPQEVAGRGGRMTFRSRGKVIARGCVAYVLNALGLRHLGRVGNGVGMTSALKKKLKWVPLKSCKNAPAGAVASWSEIGGGPGHTAIRRPGRGDGWCYDLNCNNPGSRFRLKECVVPGGKSKSSKRSRK